jgi:hypothetical protein
LVPSGFISQNPRTSLLSLTGTGKLLFLSSLQYSCQKIMYGQRQSIPVSRTLVMSVLTSEGENSFSGIPNSPMKTFLFPKYLLFLAFFAMKLIASFSSLRRCTPRPRGDRLPALRMDFLLEHPRARPREDGDHLRPGPGQDQRVHSGMSRQL